LRMLDKRRQIGVDWRHQVPVAAQSAWQSPANRRDPYSPPATVSSGGSGLARRDLRRLARSHWQIVQLKAVHRSARPTLAATIRDRCRLGPLHPVARDLTPPTPGGPSAAARVVPLSGLRRVLRKEANRQLSAFVGYRSTGRGVRPVPAIRCRGRRPQPDSK